MILRTWGNFLQCTCFARQIVNIFGSFFWGPMEPDYGPQSFLQCWDDWTQTTIMKFCETSEVSRKFYEVFIPFCQSRNFPAQLGNLCGMLFFWDYSFFPLAIIIKSRMPRTSMSYIGHTLGCMFTIFFVFIHHHVFTTFSVGEICVVGRFSAIVLYCIVLGVALTRPLSSTGGVIVRFFLYM